MSAVGTMMAEEGERLPTGPRDCLKGPQTVPIIFEVLILNNLAFIFIFIEKPGFKFFTG